MSRSARWTNSRARRCGWLLRLWEDERITVLFVTHAVREAVLLSDRVIVMSPRPGRIVEDVRIELPRPRTPAMEESPDFLAAVRRVRAALSLVSSDRPMAGD